MRWILVRSGDGVPDELHRPVRAERSPVFHRLRFLASCALGGALVTGAVLGHDVSGFDPRSIGAASGLIVGVVAVMTRSVRAWIVCSTAVGSMSCPSPGGIRRCEPWTSGADDSYGVREIGSLLFEADRYRFEIADAARPGNFVAIQVFSTVIEYSGSQGDTA